MTLNDVFGTELESDSAAQHAAASKRMFVKSQFQLALDNPKAKGRRLTALEALNSFGLDLLQKVVTEGGAGFIEDGNEPAVTIKQRRIYLKLSKRALANAAGVDYDVVAKAETPGAISLVRDLEAIAQALSLDERVLGAKPFARGDLELGARLREMSDTSERNDHFIAAISEAAWVIRRQSELSSALGASREQLSCFSEKSPDYGYPTYKMGFALAEKSRAMLGLDPLEPISSIYNLAEDYLGVPIIDVDLGEGKAGATIINGTSRGIAISKRGPNTSVLVRRMTIAHELGHLLWDPDSKLERVRVEEIGVRTDRDPVEMRANAFAVAFLAPLEAVEKIIRNTASLSNAVAKVVTDFGVSPSAAIYHVSNITGDKEVMRTISRHPRADVTRAWAQAEERPTLLGSVIESRRGKFADLAFQAARKNLITVDTLSSWLKIDARALKPFF